MQLTLFEREVSLEQALIQLRTSIGDLIRQLRPVFDLVLIDCPPGLSVVTECWLREADYHILPVVPDHLSVYALEVFSYFKGRNPEMGFAESLGVLINMKDEESSADADYERRLRGNADNRCFAQAVSRTPTLQHAIQLIAGERPYDTKYPGETGAALRAICEELLEKAAAGNAVPQPAADTAAEP
jgi:chromosome partitioning protein